MMVLQYMLFVSMPHPAGIRGVISTMVDNDRARPAEHRLTARMREWDA